METIGMSLRPEHFGLFGMIALVLITSAYVVLDCFGFFSDESSTSSSPSKGSITPNAENDDLQGTVAV